MSDPTTTSSAAPDHGASDHAAPSTGAPDDRATTFQPVTGAQPEHYNGEVLLVTAYAILWVILITWIALVWRKQSALGARLADLEREIDKAAADKPQR